MFLAALTDLATAINTLIASPTVHQPLHPTGQLINTLTETLQQITSIYHPSQPTSIHEVEKNVEPTPHPVEQRVFPVDQINKSDKPPAVPEQRMNSFFPPHTSLECYDPEQPSTTSTRVTPTVGRCISTTCPRSDHRTQHRHNGRSSPTQYDLASTMRHGQSHAQRTAAAVTSAPTGPRSPKSRRYWPASDIQYCHRWAQQAPLGNCGCRRNPAAN